LRKITDYKLKDFKGESLAFEYGIYAVTAAIPNEIMTSVLRVDMKGEDR
jgi:hypothetical protein